MSEPIISVKRENDGYTVSFPVDHPKKDAMDAASCAAVCAVLRAAKGYLDASKMLLDVFKTAERSLCRYYLESGNLSDEDIDAIAEVILNDKS